MHAFSPVDPVTDYLKRQGFTSQVAYFEASGFVMGWRVQFDDFVWVHRVEGSTLIICDFIAVEGSKGHSRAVSQFVALIQRIGRDVRGLNAVRGRFVEQLSHSQIKQNRERLASVLLAKGARWQAIEGVPWLVYSFAQEKNN